MRNMEFGRRRFLSTAGLAALGTVALGGCASSHSAPAPPPQQQVDPPEAEPVSERPEPVVRKEMVRSEARGTEVQLETVIPTSVTNTEKLPIVLYLHGRDGVEPTPIPFDTLHALEEQHGPDIAAPFGMVSVDGGYNPYWFDGADNGDLMKMLTEELPVWLRERGLGDADGFPFAVAGISTGGFGSLHYAETRGANGAPVDAVAVLSPALPTTWEFMQEKNAFSTESDWHLVNPLEHLDSLGDTPVGLWIGDNDAFMDGAEQLVHDYPNTPVFSVVPGGHDDSVFEVVGTDMVRFLADHVPTSA